MSSPSHRCVLVDFVTGIAVFVRQVVWWSGPVLGSYHMGGSNLVHV
jgi:hypothetical protein